MNLRQRKHTICNSLRGWILHKPIVFNIVSAGGTTLHDPRRMDINWKDLESKMALRNLIEEPAIDAQLEAIAEENIFGFAPTAQTFTQVVKEVLAEAGPDAVKTYTVARKKDGVIVGTFDNKEHALGMIEKAQRSKKAALVQI